MPRSQDMMYILLLPQQQARGHSEATAAALLRQDTVAKRAGAHAAASKGGANGRSFASMMAPPVLTHPTLGPPVGVRGMPHPHHWHTHQQQAAATAAAAHAAHMAHFHHHHMVLPQHTATAKLASSKENAAAAASSAAAAAAAAKKRKHAEALSLAAKTAEPPAKTARTAAPCLPPHFVEHMPVVPPWAEMAGDEAGGAEDRLWTSSGVGGGSKAAAKSNELSLADTPSRREESTPSRSSDKCPDFPASLFKIGTGGKLLADVSTLWAPMTPITANSSEFARLSASANRDNNSLLDLFAITGTPHCSHSPLRARDMHCDMHEAEGYSHVCGSLQQHQSAQRYTSPCVCMCVMYIVNRNNMSLCVCVYDRQAVRWYASPRVCVCVCVCVCV